jgi:uncharacterized membrane protein YobD (UPF0266 family)
MDLCGLVIGIKCSIVFCIITILIYTGNFTSSLPRLPAGLLSSPLWFVIFYCHWLRFALPNVVSERSEES